MTGDNLTDTQLQQIVNRTILYLDKDSDGLIGLDEFTQGMLILSKVIDIGLFIYGKTRIKFNSNLISAKIFYFSYC